MDEIKVLKYVGVFLLGVGTGVLISTINILNNL